MDPSYLSQSYHALTEIAIYQTINDQLPDHIRLLPDHKRLLPDHKRLLPDHKRPILLPDHKLPLLFITISQRPFTKPQRTDYQAINDHLPDHDRPFCQIVRDHFYQVTNYHLSNHKGPVTGL